VCETCNAVLQVGAHAIIDDWQIMIWDRKEACHSAIVGGYMWFLKSSFVPCLLRICYQSRLSM